MAKTKTPRQINAARKKEGKPPLNFALFRKVIKKLETTPEAYDQSVWGRKAESAPCGTAACIAGWAAHLGGAKSLKGIRRNTNLYNVSGSLLGLGQPSSGDWFTLSEMDVLFEGFPPDSWPDPFAEQWYRAGASHRKQARVAIRYLTHIITTGKVLE